MLTEQEFVQLDTALRAMHQINLTGMGFSGSVVSLHNVRVLVSKFSQADTATGADERAEQLGEMFAELYSKEAKSWGLDRRVLAEVAKIIREAEAAMKERAAKVAEKYGASTVECKSNNLDEKGVCGYVIADAIRALE